MFANYVQYLASSSLLEVPTLRLHNSIAPAPHILDGLADILLGDGHSCALQAAKASAHTTFPRKVVQSRPQWGSARKKRRRRIKAPPEYSPFPALQNSYRPAPLVSRWKEYCNTFNSVFGPLPPGPCPPRQCFKNRPASNTMTPNKRRWEVVLFCLARCFAIPQSVSRKKTTYARPSHSAYKKNRYRNMLGIGAPPPPPRQC